MADEKGCVNCGKPLPAATGDSTLTTSLGWRLVTSMGANGTRNLDWRCPSCWLVYKATRTAVPPVVPPKRG